MHQLSLPVAKEWLGMQMAILRESQRATLVQSQLHFRVVGAYKVHTRAQSQPYRPFPVSLILILRTSEYCSASG